MSKRPSRRASRARRNIAGDSWMRVLREQDRRISPELRAKIEAVLAELSEMPTDRIARVWQILRADFPDADSDGTDREQASALLHELIGAELRRRGEPEHVIENVLRPIDGQTRTNVIRGMR